MAPIRSWAVADFKALADAKLDLPHLTVLAGANSSGKSSVIQSLLLLAQTVGRGRPVVLNGPLTRLGLPSDVVRTGQKSIQLAFGVPVEIGSVGKPRTVILKVTVSLGPNVAGTDLVMKSIEIVDEFGVVSFAATSERMNSADADQLVKLTDAETTHLRVTRVEGKKAPSRMYLACVGVLPVSLVVHKDASTILKLMTSALAPFRDGERTPYEVVQEIGNLVDRDKFLREEGLNTTTRVPSEGKKAATIRWSTASIGSLTPEQFDKLASRVALARAKKEWVIVSPSSYRFYALRYATRRAFSEGLLEDQVANDFETELMILANIAASLQEFGGSIQYLGPLRDEPRVVHGAWDERFDALPVGIRGELTAEVLTRQRNTRINYYDWDNRRKSATLPEAVSVWCRYLGIGDNINVLDLGKQGRGVEIEVDGVNRDLTTIGVGASQLLPILVAGLSAPARGVLMIEQPELHLHPKVQSRLADFFLFSRPDVTFVVETHSEYLITRVRRRIAEAAVTPSSVQVLFAEQSSGATTVRALPLSEMGDFEVWPKGFFDAQDDDASKIVRAVTRRLSENRA